MISGMLVRGWDAASYCIFIAVKVCIVKNFAKRLL